MYFCIAKCKIHIKNKIYTHCFEEQNFFFKERLTWFEAQRCCSSRSGQLATIDDEFVRCNNIPPGAETLWTGNVRKPSEWLEFQGKLNEIEKNTHLS